MVNGGLRDKNAVGISRGIVERILWRYDINPAEQRVEIAGAGLSPVPGEPLLAEPL